MKKQTRKPRPPQKGKRQKAKGSTPPKPIFPNARLTDSGVIVSGESAASAAALGTAMDRLMSDDKGGIL